MTATASSSLSNGANISAHYNESAATSSQNPSPPYFVPFSVSLLISESLFPNFYSPAATLIIPFIRVDIPYGYFIIVGMEFVTAFLAKIAYGPSYSILPLGMNAELPDLEAFRQTTRQLPVRVLDLGGVLSLTDTESTPLFPRGMTFNISFSSPFTAPTSRTATLFTFELKEIRKVPGYLVPLAALTLYLVLRPYFRRKERNNEPENSAVAE